MTETSKKIFDILTLTQGPISEKKLALQLGYADARSLRGTGDDEGIVSRAAKEIFNETRYVLISLMRPPGIKLTRNLDEIAMANNQWNEWLWKVKKSKIDFTQKCFFKLQQGREDNEQLMLAI